MRPPQQYREQFYRYFKFGVVGSVAALVYFALLYVMVEFLGIPVLIATSVAFVLVTIENYVLHHSWTFESDQRHEAAFPKFMLASTVGFFINWGIMYVGVHLAGIHYLLVQAVAIGAVVLWNFILAASWIFPSSADEQTDSGTEHGNS